MCLKRMWRTSRNVAPTMYSPSLLISMFWKLCGLNAASRIDETATKSEIPGTSLNSTVLASFWVAETVSLGFTFGHFG